MKIELTEKVDKEKLAKVKECYNIPLDSDSTSDKDWLLKFKKMIENYNGYVTYKQKGGFGRYYGTGLQGCPRDVRKYLADKNYIDIDIVNCHPVILENIMQLHNIIVPEFLTKYNNNRDLIIKEYSLNDKLTIIKLINSEECYNTNKDIQLFHKCIYENVFPILQKIYPKITTNKEKNKCGSLMSYYLQEIENQILMCMFKKCIELKVIVGVLIFDGMMIEKETYSPTLLSQLEFVVKEKLNYNIKVVEKSMDTDWVPISPELIKEKEEGVSFINHYDPGVKKIDFDKDLSIFKGNATDAMMIPLDGKCKECHIEHQISNTGYCVKCIVCKSVFPKNQLIPLNNSYKNLNTFWNNYTQINNITINVNNNNNEDDICDIQIDESIFNDKTKTNLIQQSLDGYKISEIAKLLKLEYPNFVFDGLWYKFTNVWSVDKRNIELKKNALALKELYKKLKIFYENKRVIESFGTIIKNIKTLETKLSKPGFKDEIIKEAELFYNEDGFSYKLNSKKHLVPFKNGVFDLLTNKFRESKKEDYIQYTVNYNYINENNPEVYKFINEVLPTENVRHYVLKKMSDCLNGDIPNTNFLMFIGDTGANGKSQLLNLMKLTMGDFGEKVEVTLLTRKRNNANEANSEKIKLLNKRFAFLSEPEDGEKINIGLLKELTGSEEIVARELFQESRTFVMEAKLFLACNELPEIKGEDSALWRRIRVVDFPSRFIDEPKEENEYKIDRTLPSRMREDITWRQTFMNILLDYYNKNIIEPEDVLLKTKEYQNNNNEVDEWFNENIEPSDSSFLELKSLYELKNINKKSEKTKLKKQVEKYIKEKYNGQYECKVKNGIYGWSNYKIKE